jgi:ketosteroid isomerase-like protein
MSSTPLASAVPSARASRTWSLAALGCVFALGCAAAPPAPASTLPPPDPAASAAIHAVLDDWHRAAAAADEPRYFSHFTGDAIFLGTDKTERWDVPAFQKFAHPFFAKGKAWSFTPVRRDVIVGAGGAIAWFDEDLDTPNLGPTRGSGVIVRDPGGAWKIAHYNLAITVPNDRIKAVKNVITGETPPTKP